MFRREARRKRLRRAPRRQMSAEEDGGALGDVDKFQGLAVGRQARVPVVGAKVRLHRHLLAAGHRDAARRRAERVRGCLQQARRGVAARTALHGHRPGRVAEGRKTERRAGAEPQVHVVHGHDLARAAGERRAVVEIQRIAPALIVQLPV